MSVNTDPFFEGDWTYYSYNRPYACALATSGVIQCWGSGPARQVEPVGDAPFVRVRAGRNRFDCALDSDGAAWCFRGTDPPVRMDGEYIDIGATHRFHGLRTDGKIVTGRTTLTELSDETFVELAAGGDFVCGRRSDGAVRCFGSRIR